jgi:Fur family ferric uptake transcriptional regulator
VKENPAAGIRSTKQRAAVAAILTTISDFRSAQEIYGLLQDTGESIGLSTVYRTLQGMQSSGEVDVVLRADGESMYRRCTDGHHHHLVCRACGHTEEVEGHAVEDWADSVASKFGFTDVDHTLEIMGLCKVCS